MGLHPIFGVAPKTDSSPDDLITTRGDVIRGSSGAAAERLAIGAADTFLGSDGTDPAYVAAATQAEQETGTATNKPVTPGRQHFHQSSAKVWVKWEQTGANSIIVSYNMTSVTDGGAVGDTDHLYATDFSGSDYVLVAGALDNDIVCPTDTMLAGGCTTITRDSDSANAVDSAQNMMAIFGDQ